MFEATSHYGSIRSLNRVGEATGVMELAKIVMPELDPDQRAQAGSEAMYTSPHTPGSSDILTC